LSFSGVKSSNINGWLTPSRIKLSSPKHVKLFLKDYFKKSE